MPRRSTQQTTWIHFARFAAALTAGSILIACAGGCGVPKQRRTKPRKGPPPPAAAVESPAASLDDAGVPATEKPYEGDLKPFIVRARASSREGAKTTAELAFDGNKRTRWASVARDNERIEAYFDRMVGIRDMTIHWENARAADFSVYFQNRNLDWILAATRKNASGPVDTLTFSKPAAALGFRIQCDRRATRWGNSIYEVDVSGVAEGEPPTQNLVGYKIPAKTPWETRERDLAHRLMQEAESDPPTSENMTDEEFLDLVQKRAFYYFWYETNPTNGLTKDRGRNFDSSEEAVIGSIAAVGFGLSAYVIGAERGWIPRDQALERVVTTLRTFADGKVRNIRGFFPHFVNIFTGHDAGGTEISTIDTALLLAGMITAIEYFQDPEVARLGKTIFERVDWDWARNGHSAFIVHGLTPTGKFLDAYWGSFTEGILIYLLALGSPTHPIPAASWEAIDRHKEQYGGYEFAVEYGFQSIFRYQYPALWYDFRGRIDRSGLDYFENATRATLAMRQYCIDQSFMFPKSYGPDLWGLGAADGLGDAYMIYGFPPGDPYSPTDGTVVPYAIAGSTAFLPQHAIRALRKLYDEHHEMWGKYGFADSVNPTENFVTRDALGLDAGTVLLGIENYRSQLIWELFMKNAWIRKTTRQIGWKTRPRSTDPDGPIDLARDCQWKMRFGGTGPPRSTDGPEWIAVTVPDFWENLPGYQEYNGEAWYWTEFEIDPQRYSNWIVSGRPIVLILGAVDDADEAFINGQRVGATQNGPDVWRLSRLYPVRGTILKPGINQLLVRVTDVSGKGGIWRTPVEIGLH